MGDMVSEIPGDVDTRDNLFFGIHGNRCLEVSPPGCPGSQGLQEMAYELVIQEESMDVTTILSRPGEER